MSLKGKRFRRDVGCTLIFLLDCDKHVERVDNKHTLFDGLAYNTCAYFFQLFWWESLTEHPDSVCNNDVNNEQHCRAYYMPNLWMRGQLFYCKRKKILFWFLFSSKRYPKYPDSVRHSCSFCIRRYSPCCKPVKLGHYSVLRPRILRVLLTLYGKMT